MKERVCGIFERWDQRNTEYYKESFKKLEKENQLTFNFAAAFGNVLWLIFRKMYGWAILVTLANAVIQIPMRMLSSTSSPSMLSGISILSFLIWFSVLGFFGNTLYYKHVKSQISKGYAKMPDYNPIDPIWSFIGVGILVPFFVGILSGILIVIGKGIVSTNGAALLSILLQILILSIPWMMDQKKFCPRESVKSVNVTEKSIDQFLEKSDQRHMFIAVSIWIVSMILSIVFAYMAIKAVSSITSNQATGISEKIDKTPKSSQLLTDFSGDRPVIDE